MVPVLSERLKTAHVLSMHTLTVCISSKCANIKKLTLEECLLYWLNLKDNMYEV